MSLKDKQHYQIGVFIISLFIVAFMFIITIKIVNRTMCEAYSADLQEQGYSATWAIHKANVEYGYSEPDELYWAIEED